MEIQNTKEHEDSTITSGKRKLPGFICCCISRRKCKISRHQLKIYIALFLSMFGSAYSITMLFPFLPFMVQFLLPEIDPSSVGKYAGMVASAMFLGRFIGSYTWGALSDLLGHKPVLIISSVLLGIASFLFGLSINFPMAIAMRFLVGLVNGIVGNSKASMSENTTNQNHALGMSILASSYGVGIVIGPAISGAVSDPIQQYDLNITNNAIRSLLTNYPYSLPCFINTLVCFGSAVAALVLLPQTKRKKRNSSIELSSSPPSLSTITQSDDDTQVTDTGTVTPTEREEDKEPPVTQEPPQQSDIQGDSFEEQNAAEGQVQDTTENNEESLNTAATRRAERKPSFVLSVIQGRRNTATLQYVKLPRSVLLGKRKRRERMEAQIEEEEEECEGERGGDKEQLLSEDHKTKARICSKTWWSRKGRTVKASALLSLRNIKFFFKDPVTRLTLIIYSVYSFAVIGFDEIYSLWCATPAYLGGLSFTLSEIGTSLSIVGVMLLPFTLCFYPFLERKFGTIKTYMMTNIVLIFSLILLPSLHFLVPLNQSIALWTGLSISMLIIRVFIGVGFGCTSLMVNNSTTFDKLGSINGLALMMTSGFRFVSPLFAGYIYSVSLSDANQSLGFPVDYHLIFIIFGLILLVVLIMTSYLPLSINNQKIISEDEASKIRV